jgi:hypothetical protein
MSSAAQQLADHVGNGHEARALAHDERHVAAIRDAGRPPDSSPPPARVYVGERIVAAVTWEAGTRRGLGGVNV